MSDFQSNLTCQKFAKCSAIAVTCIYILFGLTFVCHGFYKTIAKLADEQVFMRDVQLGPDKVKYPSVTFCYKYKHGGKDVFGTYSQKFYEKWKKSGKILLLIQEIFISV